MHGFPVCQPALQLYDLFESASVSLIHAREEGFEPSLAGSKPAVLPLNDSRMMDWLIRTSWVSATPLRARHFELHEPVPAAGRLTPASPQLIGTAHSAWVTTSLLLTQLLLLMKACCLLLFRCRCYLLAHDAPSFRCRSVVVLRRWPVCPLAARYRNCTGNAQARSYVASR